MYLHIVHYLLPVDGRALAQLCKHLLPTPACTEHIKGQVTHSQRPWHTLTERVYILVVLLLAHLYRRTESVMALDCCVTKSPHLAVVLSAGFLDQHPRVHAVAMDGLVYCNTIVTWTMVIWVEYGAVDQAHSDPGRGSPCKSWLFGQSAEETVGLKFILNSIRTQSVPAWSVLHQH